MELHRGRLIDHVQLVVKDLAASKRFYLAAFGVLGIPLAGEGKDHFWADELFVSSRDSKDAMGQLTGRVHLAFQAQARKWWTGSTRPRWPPADGTTARRGSALTIPATTPASSS